VVRERLTAWNIAVVILFVVVALGATMQTGVLIPKFRDEGERGTMGGGSSEVYANTVENQSLRSWTITGLELPAGKTVSMPDGSTVHIGGIYRGTVPNPAFHGNAPAYSPSLTSGRRQQLPLSIGPGQELTVTLVQKGAPACRPVIMPRDPRHWPPPHKLPAAIAIGTPIGSRTVATTFSVNDMCASR
jgi:hypothetical protein